MNKEIRDLLEKAKDHYWDTLEPHKELILKHFEALDILKKPECKTCGDTKRVPSEYGLTQCSSLPISPFNTKPCPDCQQPPAGDLTKRIRLNFKDELAFKTNWPQLHFKEFMSKKDWNEEIERLRYKSVFDNQPVRVPEKIWRAMLLNHKDTMVIGGNVRIITGRKIGPGVYELTLVAKAKIEETK